MPKHIKLADFAPDETTVELADGNVYQIVPLTRSVQKKLEQVDRELRKIDLDENEDADAVVSVMIDGLSALLKPKGKAPAVKAALTAAWESDDLSLAQIRGLMETAQESAVERPT